MSSQSSASRIEARDEARDEGIVDGVDLETERGEGVGDGGVEGGDRGGGDEVELDRLGAGGVLDNGVDRCHGAAEVGDVERHCHVDKGVCLAGGRRGGGERRRAFRRVVELRGLTEVGCDGGGGGGGGEDEEEGCEEGG